MKLENGWLLRWGLRAIGDIGTRLLMIVFVELPTGQVSWHIRENERGWFEGLANYNEKWDGHTTPEKYQRMRDARPWLLELAKSLGTHAVGCS